jgi:hypothetical protein
MDSLLELTVALLGYSSLGEMIIICEDDSFEIGRI